MGTYAIVFLAVLLQLVIRENRGHSLSFLGGYAHWNLTYSSTRLQMAFDFNRSPLKSDGILFFLHSTTSESYFGLFLVNGRLVSSLSASGTASVHSHTASPLPAAEWTTLSVSLLNSSLSVGVDANHSDVREVHHSVDRFVRNLTDLYIAGLPSALHSAYPDVPTHASFHGCMQNWVIGSAELSLDGSDSRLLETVKAANGCCVETTVLCELTDPIEIPSSCPLSMYNVSWNQIDITRGNLNVIEGGQASLDVSILQVNFPLDVAVSAKNSVYRSLSFTVLTPPKHGSLKYSRRSEIIMQLTYAKLELSSIFYLHDGSESVHDMIEFQVNATCSGGFVVFSRQLFVSVVIQPQNDSPVISQLSTLRLAVGTRTRLTREVISVSDPDSNEDAIRLEVVSIEHGRFEEVSKPGTEIRLFRQQQLTDGAIAFQHFYASKSIPFTTLLIIKDEQNSLYQQLTVEPFVGKISVVNNTNLKVIEGSSDAIQLRTLGVTTNFENQNPELRFTLKEEPVYGFIQVFRSLLQISEPTWQNVSQGQFFTRQEVVMSHVQYVHDWVPSNDTQFDRFVVDASSYEAPGPRIEQQVEVIPRDSLLETRFEVVTQVLELREGQTVSFDHENLQVNLLPNSLMQLIEERSSFESLGILFTVAVPPQHGSILLNTQPLNTSIFTLQQLKAGLLSYAHDSSENHRDSIALLVHATMIEKTELRIHPPGLATAILDIHILPVNNHKPTVKVLEAISPLEGSLVPIDPSVLEIVDQDGPGDVLTMSVERFPNDNGYFSFSDNYSAPVVQFTMSDVRSGSLVFHHLFGSALQRRYPLVVFDGFHHFVMSIIVRARPVFLNVSLGENGLSCPYSFDAVEQVGYKFSSQSFIIATDAPHRIADIKLVVRRGPHHGQLMLDDRVLYENDEFFMRSVHNGEFKYDFSSDLTKQTFEDNFTLTFFLGSTSKVILVPVCINPVPVPKLLTPPESLSIRVPVNGVGMITTQVLSSSDTRGGLFLEHLIYEITIAPTLGSLVNLSEGDDRVQVFTQSDVDQNRIAYVHSGIEQTSNDNFTFKLRNAFVTLPPVQFIVDIYHTNLTIARAGFVVEEGARHVITPEEFQIYSPPGYSVWITIITPPHHGVLLYGKSYLESIGTRAVTPYSISLGLLSYRHDDSESLHDDFEFEVYPNVTDPIARIAYTGISDSIQSYRGIVHINITLINDNAPKFVYGAPIVRVAVWEAGSTNVSSEVLLFHDTDLGNDDNLLIYTMRPISEISEHICGYFYLSSAPRKTAIYTFIQEDILSGRLWYQHVRSDGCTSQRAPLDTYIVDVSDGQNIASVTLILEIKEFVIVPVVKKLEVKEGGEGIIGIEQLQAYVEGNSIVNESDIVFTIVHQPFHGHLLVNSTSFSQEELKSRPVIYIHDNSETTDDFFTFRVGIWNFTTEDANFSIAIIPVDDTPPLFEVVESVHVLEGDRMYINQSVLRASDSEAGPSQLHFLVSLGPMYGSLRKVLSQNRFEDVTQFTQQDINSKLIYYLNEQVSPTWTDSFQLVLSDGINVNEDLGVLDITIMPVVLPVQIIPLVVYEGKLSVFSSSLIVISHPVYRDQGFYFRVTHPPENGTIHYLGNQEVDWRSGAFTSNDLRQRTVIYAHDGSETRSDSFKIVVTSDVDGMSSNPVDFPINIIPVNDEKPVLVGGGLPVVSILNGNSVVLTPKILNVTDKDTDSSNVTFYFSPPVISSDGQSAYFYSGNDLTTSILSFTQEAVSHLSITLVHPGHLYNATWPFNVTDGETVIFGNLTIQTIPIVITVKNNRSITVDMEASSVIGSYNLRLETSDGSDRMITYTVLEDCLHGDLLFRGEKLNDSFTQNDIDSNFLSYRHYDMEQWVTGDVFLFTASAEHGEFFGVASFPITIRLRSSNSSLFAVNKPLEVLEGGTANITTSYLDVRNIRYQVWKNLSLQSSISEMTIRFSPGNSLKHGKLYANEVGILSLQDHFWQKDVPLLAQYEHDGSDTELVELHLKLDIFPANATYVATSLVKIPVQIFTIRIIPVNDGVPHLAASLTLQVVEGFPYTITKNELSVKDPDTGPDSIVYSVITPLIGWKLEVDGQENALSFSQADIDNRLVRIGHEYHQSGLTEVELMFRFSDGNHSENGTLSINLVPHYLLYAGPESPILVYEQDQKKIPIPRSLLDIETNGRRSETYYEVTTQAGSLYKHNNSASIFTQADIDRGIIFYVPYDLSALTDTFTIVIENHHQNITVHMDVLVKSRVKVKSVTLDSTVTNPLQYAMPPELFALPDATPTSGVSILVLSEPKFGVLSRRSPPREKRQTSTPFEFAYSELNSRLIYYTVRKELQSSEQFELVESFEIGIKLTPDGQLGYLNTSYKVAVPSLLLPTLITPSSTTEPGAGNAPEDGNDFSVYIVIPVLGTASVMMIVVSIIFGSLVVRYYRLRKRVKQRKKVQLAKEKEARGTGSSATEGYSHSERQDGTLSEGTILDNQERLGKQPYSLEHSMLSSGMDKSSPLQAHPFQQLSPEPMEFSIPRSHGEEYIHASSPRISPDTAHTGSTPNSRLSPTLKSFSNKEHLKYDTSAVDPNVKKLFRSDHPQLKHVEYWV